MSAVKEAGKRYRDQSEAESEEKTLSQMKQRHDDREAEREQ